MLHVASGLVFPSMLKTVFLIYVWKHTHPATQHHIPEHLNPQLHCYRSTYPAMQHHIPELLNPQLYHCKSTTQLHSITSLKTCILNYTTVETPSNASHPRTPEYSTILL